MKQRPTRSLGEGIKLLQEQAKKDAIFVRTFFELLAGRGYPFIIILFSLPFCLPIQIPGLSTPFGIAIAILGLRSLFGHAILLPKRLLDKEVPQKVVDHVVAKTEWIIQKLKRLTQPRWSWITESTGFRVLNGICTILLGVALALPLPIPFTNLMSAWALLFLNVGILEDDGAFIALGYLFTLFCIVFYWALFALARAF